MYKLITKSNEVSVMVFTKRLPEPIGLCLASADRTHQVPSSHGVPLNCGV